MRPDQQDRLNAIVRAKMGWRAHCRGAKPNERLTYRGDFHPHWEWKDDNGFIVLLKMSGALWRASRGTQAICIGGPARMIPQTPEALAAEIVARADYFTTCRFLGRGRYDRREFPTLAEAAADAKGDRRALIYAVAGMRSVHISNEGDSK